jgi:7,8-dihydropterin-6-yl-methyl-4-(beta-D-ribofuranosyl)aminobenzene 5'-phosphate synthase
VCEGGGPAAARRAAPRPAEGTAVDPIALEPVDEVVLTMLVDNSYDGQWDLPTLSRTALEAEGFSVVERRQPSLLLDGSVLITGEVDRTTDFERGLPHHETLCDGRWEPDPLVLDEQALVVLVRGRGLVVLVGCSHTGAVNAARHALRLTGTDRLHALLGGFHLTGPAFAPIIEPTVSAFAELAPDVLVPAHCTGWRAQQRFAAALPDAFVPNAVGTAYTFAAAPVG